MKPKQNTNNNKVKILIVEDSPTQAMKLQHFLEQNKYTVSVAQDGLDALAFLKKHRPTLIISDVVMPKMDGYELCQKIKKDEKLKSIPIIILTSLTEPEDIIKGLTCGADNFVTKPYDEEVLLSSVNYILVNQSMRQKKATEMGIEIFFSGQRHFITSDRMQILDLLISTYEVNVQKGRELKHANKELEKSQAKLKTFNEQLEQKVLERTERISHLNQMILAVRNVNQLITKENDRNRLIKGVCENLISTKCFNHAWIALINESGKVIKTSEAGMGEKFLPVAKQLESGELTACMKMALTQPELVAVEEHSACGECPLTVHCTDAKLCIRLESQYCPVKI